MIPGGTEVKSLDNRELQLVLAFDDCPTSVGGYSGHPQDQETVH